jgi:hypothetical protein
VIAVATAVARVLLAVLERIGGRVDVILPNGEHRYRCTGHRHGIAEHCTSDTRLDGAPKLPAKCKWCPAPCGYNGGTT